MSNAADLEARGDWLAERPQPMYDFDPNDAYEEWLRDEEDRALEHYRELRASQQAVATEKSRYVTKGDGVQPG